MKFLNINGTTVTPDCKINLIANPKRTGSKSWVRYEEYCDSKTIQEYLDNGGLKEDLRWDEKKKFLTILEKYSSKSKSIIKNS